MRSPPQTLGSPQPECDRIDPRYLFYRQTATWEKHLHPGFDLPQSYKERTFIKGLAGFVNNIDQLVGAMILIEDNKTSVLTRFVRQDKPPVVSTTTSDVIYSAKIDSKFKFNGAYCIASTKVEKDNIYELIIKDVAVAFLPEDYIPYLEICRAATNVAPETRRKVEDETTRDAIRAFQSRAAVAADQLGKVWKIKQLNIQQGGSMPMPVMRAGRGAMMAEAAPAPLEAGESQVTTTISGQIELAD